MCPRSGAVATNQTECGHSGIFHHGTFQQVDGGRCFLGVIQKDYYNSFAEKGRTWQSGHKEFQTGIKPSVLDEDPGEGGSYPNGGTLECYQRHAKDLAGV